MALLQAQTAHPLTLEYAVDNAPDAAGSSIAGVPIFHSSRLMEERKQDLLVIIYANTSRAVLEIASSLNRMGFVWGEHYIDCSLLHFHSMGRRLKHRLGIEPSFERFFRARMLSLYMGFDNHSSVAGTWLFIELLEHCCRQVAGDIAECGVYKGGNALVTLLSSDVATSRPYHLFDSFAGFPEVSQFDPGSRQNDFQDVDFARIADVFRNYNNVIVHKGYFEATLPTLDSRDFSMVYADCDLYEPTLLLCNYFYNRIPEGGCLLFHDYWVPEQDPPHRTPFRGINRSVNEFLGGNVEKLVVFPETTHAVLIR